MSEKQKPKEKPKRKEHKTKHDRTVANLQKFFKYALLVSFLGHSPAIFGSMATDKKSFQGEIGFIDYAQAEGKNTKWEQEATSEIEEDLHQKMHEEEIRKFMEEMDPEILEGYEKAKMAIKMREAERTKRIDPARIKAHKEEIRKKLEAGEHILFRDFVFETEEIAMGIDPGTVEAAKMIFAAEMDHLESIKPSKPTRKFLQEVVYYTESKEKDIEYEPTRTSVSEYLHRKGKGKRGNCQARARYSAMALEYLYPKLWEKVWFQETGNHIRTLFEVDGKMHRMERGVPLLDDREKDGTVIYKPQSVINIYAGLEEGTLKVENTLPDKEKKKKEKKGLGAVMEKNPFGRPKTDGKLRDTDEDMSHLYKPKYIAPEVADVVLVRSGIKPKGKKIKQLEEGKAGEPEPLDVLAPHVVKGEGGKTEEILGWEPVDVPELEIMERVRGNHFYGGIEHGGSKSDVWVLNPSVDVVKKINALNLGDLQWGNPQHFSQAALREIAATNSGTIGFNLDHMYMPMALRSALSHKVFHDYKGVLSISIDRELEGRIPDEGEDDKLDPEHFRLLMDGKGPLRLNYKDRKFLNEEEVKMIAGSSRPYVYFAGDVCAVDKAILRHMKESNGTVLALRDVIYFQLVLEDPTILENEFIAPAGIYMEYQFPSDLQAMYVLKHVFETNQTAPHLRAKLDRLIKLTETKFQKLIPYDTVELKKFQDAAAKRIEENIGVDTMIGSMGFCKIPETSDEADMFGVETKHETSPTGVNYVRHWSGRVDVENGIEYIGDIVKVTLPTRQKIQIAWVNDKFIDIYSEDLMLTENESSHMLLHISNNRLGLRLKPKESLQPKVYVVELVATDLLRIMDPAKNFILVKLPPAPKTPSGEMLFTDNEGRINFTPFGGGATYVFSTDFTGKTEIRDKNNIDTGAYEILPGKSVTVHPYGSDKVWVKTTFSIDQKGENMVITIAGMGKRYLIDLVENRQLE